MLLFIHENINCSYRFPQAVRFDWALTTNHLQLG